MSTFDPTGAFGHWPGQNPGFPEQFEGNTGADDIHDAIHRANFMKMHLVRLFAVNFAFCHRHPMKHGNGLFLNPR